MQNVAKKNLKSISLPLATAPNFIRGHEKKARPVKRKAQDVKWVIIQVRSSLDVFTCQLFWFWKGARTVPRGCAAGEFSEAKCPEVNSSEWLTVILLWLGIIPFENSCYYYVLMVEKYWSDSIKRIKQTSVCVDIAERDSSFVLCVLLALILGARWCAGTHISQWCFLCIVLFPSFFLVSANIVILIILDMSGALQLRAPSCLFWLRSHRMSTGLSGIYLFCLNFWQ